MCAQRLGNTQGKWHEERVFEYLAANLPDDYKLLTNRVLARDKSNYREFDLILLAKRAVYIIEIKHVQAAEIRGNAEEWRWDSYLPGSGDYVIESPLKQVNEQWKILSEKLKGAGASVFVSDLVCLFSDERIEMRVQDDAKRLEKAQWYKDFPHYLQEIEEKQSGDILPLHPRLVQLVDTNFESRRLERRMNFEIEDEAWRANFYTAYYVHTQSAEDGSLQRFLLKIYSKDFVRENGTNLLEFLKRLKERNQTALEQLQKGKIETGGLPFVFVSPIHYYLDKDEYLITSRWVEGQPLAYILKKSFPSKYLGTIAAQICRGLAYLHSARVFHRNLSLENILWNPAEKQIRIINFDFAKLMGKGTMLNTQTAPLLGREVGGNNRKYQAPELRTHTQVNLPQSVEDLYHNADFLTDTYSLGVILLELFTQPLKPDESTPERLQEIGHLDERVRNIITTFCNPDPAERAKISLLEAAESFERIAHNVLPTQDLFHLHQGDNLGFYEIQKTLPSNELSVVYLAKDGLSRDNRLVVIKVQKRTLAHDTIPDEVVKSRAILEEIDIQFTARLLKTEKAFIFNNKALLQYTPGAQEAYYQIWEYIEGDDLDNYLKSLPPYKPAEASPERIDERFRLGVGVLKALSALHKNNWIHQDTKPKNFMRTPEGQIKIIDFGLSKRASESPNVTGGTPCYIPPEATAKNEWTMRGDVWACGCMLIHILCGSEVCSSDDIQKQIQKNRNEKALGIEAIRVLEKATRANPEDRYPTALEFLAEFEFAYEDWKNKLAAPNARETNMDDIIQKLTELADKQNSMGDIDAWANIHEDISAYETWLSQGKTTPCPVDLEKYGLTESSAPAATRPSETGKTSAPKSTPAPRQPQAESPAPTAQAVKAVISALQAETPPPPAQTAAPEPPPSAPEQITPLPAASGADTDLIARVASEQAGAEQLSLRRDLDAVRAYLASQEWRPAVGLAAATVEHAHDPVLKNEARDLLDQARRALNAALQAANALGDSARSAENLDEARAHYQSAQALDETDSHSSRALQEIARLAQAQLSEERRNALRSGLKERKDIHRLGEAVYEAEALDGEGKLPADLAELTPQARAEYDALRKAHGEETTQMRFGDLQARSDAVAKLRQRVATGEKLIYDATTNTEKPAFDLLREANALLEQASEDTAQYELDIAEKNKNIRPLVARERLEKALTQPFSEQYQRNLQQKLDEVNGFIAAQQKAEELQRLAGLESDDVKKFALLLQAAQTFGNLPGLEEGLAQARGVALNVLQARVSHPLLQAEQAIRSQEYARARQETQQAETLVTAWPEMQKPEEIVNLLSQAQALRQRIDQTESAWGEYSRLSAAIRQQVTDSARRAAALDLFRQVNEDERFKDFVDRRLLASEIDQYKGVGEQLADAQSAKDAGDWSRVFEITKKVIESGKAGALAAQFNELYADAVTELNISRMQELLSGDDVFEANNILTATQSKEERDRGKARRDSLDARLKNEIELIDAAIHDGRAMQTLFEQAGDLLGLRDSALFRLYFRPAAGLRQSRVGADGAISNPELRNEINRLKQSPEAADPTVQELAEKSAQSLLETLNKKGFSERLRALRLLRYAGGDKTQTADPTWPPYSLSLITAEARRAARLVADSLRNDVFQPLKQKRNELQGKEQTLDDETLRQLAYQASGLREVALLETEDERAVGRWAEVEWGKRQAKMEEAHKNWESASGLWKDLDTHHPGLPEIKNGLRNARIQHTISRAHVLVTNDHRGEQALALLKELQDEPIFSNSPDLNLALADTYAALGNFDPAFANLELAARVAEDEKQRIAIGEHRAALEIRKIVETVKADAEKDNLRELRPADALRLLQTATKTLESKSLALENSDATKSEIDKALAALGELSQVVYARAEAALLRKSQEQQATGSNEGKIQAVVALVDLQALEELAKIDEDKRRSTQGLNHLRDDLAHVAEELVRNARDFEPAAMNLAQATATATELTTRLQTLDNVMPLFTAQLAPMREKFSASRDDTSQLLKNLNALKKLLDESQSQSLWDDALRNGSFQTLEQYQVNMDKLELGRIPEALYFKNRLSELQEIYLRLLDMIQAVKREFSVNEDFEEARRIIRASLTHASARATGQLWQAVQQKDYETVRNLLSNRLRVTDLYGAGDLVGWEAVEQAADQRYAELEAWKDWDKQASYKMDAAWQALQITETHTVDTPHRVKRANSVKVQQAASAALEMLQAGPTDLQGNSIAVHSKAARDFQKEAKSRIETAEGWLHGAETQILVLDNILTERGFPTDKEFADAASQKDADRLEKLLQRAREAGTIEENERKRVAAYQSTLQRLRDESKRRWWNLG